MAFRIQHAVLRGEIDNRRKGSIRGKIWLAGRPDPLILELTGNPHPDLAGCLLHFQNPNPSPSERDPHTDALAPVQRGTAGDLTASRKVRVFEVPLEEALAMIRRREKPPERMANCLYLEWFSELNGRVVIEATDFHLTVSSPQWQMTPDENEQRARQAAAGMAGFLAQLTAAIETQRDRRTPPKGRWDDRERELLLREGDDTRPAAFSERIENYGGAKDGLERIKREMGLAGNEAHPEPDPSGAGTEADTREDDESDQDESPFVPDPSREGLDWMRDEEGDVVHPLQHRCWQTALRFDGLAEMLDPEEVDLRDVDYFVACLQLTACKLAGALDGVARGVREPNRAYLDAGLKRALGHLHEAQRGLERTASKSILTVNELAEGRREIQEIRQEILDLMDRYRRRERR